MSIQLNQYARENTFSILIRGRESRGHICAGNICARSLERKNERGQWHKERRLTVRMIYYRFLEAIIAWPAYCRWSNISADCSFSCLKQWYKKSLNQLQKQIFRLKAYKLYLDIDKNIMLVEIWNYIISKDLYLNLYNNRERPFLGFPHEKIIFIV